MYDVHTHKRKYDRVTVNQFTVISILSFYTRPHSCRRKAGNKSKATTIILKIILFIFEKKYISNIRKVHRTIEENKIQVGLTFIIIFNVYHKFYLSLS